MLVGMKLMSQSLFIYIYIHTHTQRKGGVLWLLYVRWESFTAALFVSRSHLWKQSAQYSGLGWICSGLQWRSEFAAVIISLYLSAFVLGQTSSIFWKIKGNKQSKMKGYNIWIYIYLHCLFQNMLPLLYNTIIILVHCFSWHFWPLYFIQGNFFVYGNFLFFHVPIASCVAVFIMQCNGICVNVFADISFSYHGQHFSSNDFIFFSVCSRKHSWWYSVFTCRPSVHYRLFRNPSVVTNFDSWYLNSLFLLVLYSVRFFSNANDLQEWFDTLCDRWWWCW